MASELRNETMRKIVEATRELIEVEETPSSRMIADRVGVTSPIIFHYFGDMEMLMLVATYDIVAEYDNKIIRVYYKDMSSLEWVKAIWEIYAEYSTVYPNIFNTLYFGKHGNEMDVVKRIYQDLYPDEDTIEESRFSSFYHGANIITRQKELLNLIKDEVDSINSDNIDTIALVQGAIVRFMLEYSLENPEMDPKEVSKKLLNAIYFTMGLTK